MKKIKTLSSIALLSAATLVLSACGNKADNNTDDSKKASKFPTEMPKKEAKQGGTVKYAIETNSPFTGIFASELAFSKTDIDLASPGNEKLFDIDDDYRINDKGPAVLKIDKEKKTVTITIKKGVKWSDGKQVTAKDLEFPYEILANKATKSQRYTSQLEYIKGMKAYHEGKAKTISGLEMPDGENGRTLTIHLSLIHI